MTPCRNADLPVYPLSQCSAWLTGEAGILMQANIAVSPHFFWLMNFDIYSVPGGVKVRRCPLNKAGVD